MQHCTRRKSATGVRRLCAIVLGGCLGCLASAEAKADVLEHTGSSSHVVTSPVGIEPDTDEPSTAEFVAVETSPETAPAPTPPTAEPATCFPDCRAGYVCHQGECISACNPVCGEDQECTDEGECVAPASAVEPTTPDPTPPAAATAPAPAPVPASAKDPATPPAATPPAATQDRVAASPYDRNGLVVGADLGIRACFTDSCRARAPDFVNHDVVRGGVSLRASLTYRFIAYVSAGVELELGGHGLKYREEGTERARLISWSIVPMLYGHPLAFSRWDPFVGLGLGYTQDGVRKSGSFSTTTGANFDLATRDRTRRGVFRFAFGLDVYLDSRLSIGPRISVDRQFAGRRCLEATVVENECTSIDEPPALGLPDPIQDGPGRIFATFGVGLRAHL